MSDYINTEGMKFYEIEEISVNEWHPLPNGEGKPTQVHMMVKLADNEYPLVMRFKSARPVDELIMALITHRNGVWPVRKPPTSPEVIINKSEGL
jgi:hypothetical protein